MEPKRAPNGIPTVTRTVQNRLLGLQGALGDSWGALGYPRLAPDTARKLNQISFKIHRFYEQ